MKGTQFKRIRERLELSQEQLAEVLCLSTKQAVSNIETEFRNPGKLTIVVMSILGSLSVKRANEMVQLFLEHGNGVRDQGIRTKRE